MRRLRLAAYGNSVYLRGIAACLAADVGLSVSLVDPNALDARERLDEIAPDAIAFESDTAFLALPISLSRERPSLLLVAFDSGSDAVLVLSGQRSQPTTARDLVDVLVQMIPEAALVG